MEKESKLCARDEKGRFVKGNRSGGRKKIPVDVKKLYQEASAEATQLLIETMHNDEVKIETRLSCAEKIIDRVYGKATKIIEDEFDEDKPFVVEIKVIE